MSAIWEKQDEQISLCVTDPKAPALGMVIHRDNKFIGLMRFGGNESFETELAAREWVEARVGT